MLETLVLIRKNTYNPSEEAYLAENGRNDNKLNAGKIRLFKAKTMARQRYSPKWVWENQLEPML